MPASSPAAACKRINVSLDTLDADKFRAHHPLGRPRQGHGGLDAAQAAGLKVKINAVALKGVNEDEIEGLLEWAHGRGMDLTLIEVMPLGEIETQRIDQFLPLSLVRARLGERYTLEDLDERTGGPARYVRVKETGGQLGFITPMTHNFCESCNRVRLTCTGQLYMCLGQEDAADLRTPLRLSEGNERLEQAIEEAIARKPKGHDFIIDRGIRCDHVIAGDHGAATEEDRLLRSVLPHPGGLHRFQGDGSRRGPPEAMARKEDRHHRAYRPRDLSQVLLQGFRNRSLRQSEEANLDLLVGRIDAVFADELLLAKFLESREVACCHILGDAPARAGL